MWGESDRYCIQTIAQRKPPQDSLKCSFLAEVLGLSSNKKQYLYHFNLKEGEEKLQNTLIIKDATITKIKPSTLFVEYKLRNPIAYIGNCSNMAIDDTGVFIPFSPFYTPKNIPEIYLGTYAENISWGKKMVSEKFSLVQEFLNMFPPYSISLLDLSKIEAETLGAREIVLKMKDGQFLRLTPRGYKQEIEEYNLLMGKALDLSNRSQVIDLRVPHVAFMGLKKNDELHTNPVDVQ